MIQAVATFDCDPAALRPDHIAAEINREVLVEARGWSREIESPLDKTGYRLPGRRGCNAANFANSRRCIGEHRQQVQACSLIQGQRLERVGKRQSNQPPRERDEGKGEKRYCEDL